MKRNYYRTMGWDEVTGMPLPQTLHELDLDDLIAEFQAGGPAPRQRV